MIMRRFLQHSLTALSIWLRRLSICLADLTFNPRAHKSVAIAGIDIRSWRLSSYAQNANSRLLGLPPEVRRLIYRDLLIADALSIQLDPKRWCIHTEILRVCRLTYLEAPPVLYDENCFIMVEELVGKIDGSALEKLGANLCRSSTDPSINEAFITQKVIFSASVVFDGGILEEEENSTTDTYIGGLITLAHMFKLINWATSLPVVGTAEGTYSFDIQSPSLGPLTHSQQQFCSELRHARGQRIVNGFDDDDDIHVLYPGETNHIAEEMEQALGDGSIQNRLSQFQIWRKDLADRRPSNSLGLPKERYLCALQTFEYIDQVVLPVYSSVEDATTPMLIRSCWGKAALDIVGMHQQSDDHKASIAFIFNFHVDERRKIPWIASHAVQLYTYCIKGLQICGCPEAARRMRFSRWLLLYIMDTTRKPDEKIRFHWTPQMR